MKYSEEYIGEEIRTAKKAIAESGLYKTNITGKLKYELYCIPSHDHYCYYAQILCSQDKKHMLYARTEIDDLICGKIFMYPFSDVEKCRGSSRSYGKIVCGMREISGGLYERLIKISHILPDKKEWQEIRGMMLDGVFQMIRIYENDAVIKELAYFDCENDLLDNLYEAVEAEIKG